MAERSRADLTEQLLRRGALALALVIAGCAAAPRPPDSTGSRGLRVILTPLNLALRLPEELRESSDRVWPVLVERGMERTRNLAVLQDSDAWELWKGVLLEAQLQGEPELATVLRQFAREVREQTEFDLLLVPSLVYREAPYDGSSARWDGVRRRIVQRQDGQRPGTEWAFAGKITGVSLHMLAFDQSGNELGQCWGGLDLAHEILLEGTEHTLVPLAEPLANGDHLREGIDLALDRCL